MSVFVKSNFIISMHTCERHGFCVFYVSVSVRTYLCLRCVRIIRKLCLCAGASLIHEHGRTSYIVYFRNGCTLQVRMRCMYLSASGLERLHECLPSPQSHHAYTSVPLLVPLTPIYIISYVSITPRFGLRGMVAKTSVGDAAPVSRSVSWSSWTKDGLIMIESNKISKRFILSYCNHIIDS